MKMIELDLKPNRKALAQFGLATFFIFGLLGSFVFWKKSLLGISLNPETARTIAGVLWAIGSISGLFALIRPAWNRPLYVGLILLTFPIGFVMSYVIMGVIYYLIFTPVALLFRLIGRDALHRRFDPKAASYWVEHREVENVERYFRQY